MSGGKGGAAAKGMADAKDKGMAAAKGAADKAMAMFKGAAAKAGVPTGIPGKGGAAELEEALITAILKSVKGKKSSSPYIMLAQFILNVRTQAKLNYSLASKLIKSLAFTFRFSKLSESLFMRPNSSTVNHVTHNLGSCFFINSSK